MNLENAFPVATKTYSLPIAGIDTQFSLSAYSDRILIIATQTGTFGSIIEATQDSSYQGQATFSTNILMGKRDEPLLLLCARQVVELAAAAGCSKPMVLCLGLKDHSPGTIKAIIAAISENKLW